ncbi:sensor domain-containing diguanylate cyclase [uncultured Pseudacidovorax sp.]|uniref:sensor domain-containing diguanylate cyclase n=1 Tax=uncultured Pseudacidovorax sp. TaxID=679313 RepID=UPI0025E21C72|nr:sensor domain-containing diguanylate cyclase [uncultured Pseudacidovorax sp.]
MKIFPYSFGQLSRGKPRVYWLVSMNRRNRGIFYVLLFLAVGSHLAVVGASFTAWALLALQFLLYPQFAYFAAVRSEDQRKAEHRNQLLDGFWAGCWMAGLGFPLWISFTMFAGACLHMVVFYGLRGLPMVLGAMGLGAGMVALTGNWSGTHFDTDLRTTALSMVSLTLFFVTYALDGYRRAMYQHASEMKLRAQVEEIKALQARLYEQTMCDPLTGLFNRRHLEKALPSAIESAQAEGHELALLIVDIDHFKNVNDRYGHDVGDEVLKSVASIMQTAAQPEELVYRYGGEEFVILLPGCTADAAMRRAEQLRSQFLQTPLVLGEGAIHGTLSCGISVYPTHGANARELLRSADAALYRAKAKGRNRSEIFGASTVEFGRQATAETGQGQVR